jgi:hypothetical protein
MTTKRGAARKSPAGKRQPVPLHGQPATAAVDAAATLTGSIRSLAGR